MRRYTNRAAACSDLRAREHNLEETIKGEIKMLDLVLTPNDALVPIFLFGDCTVSETIKVAASCYCAVNATVLHALTAYFNTRPRRICTEYA